MNAITVNYAEVGDDHLPRSFGLVRNIDLDNQTVYNSNITEITGTNYSILQSRDIGTKDIIVSSDTKSSRLLSNFTSGPTSWINHRIPDSDSTAYIFYKDDGYYYKMVEDENGRPVQAKYAPYAYLTNVKDNAGIQPYCEATIETPVELQVSAGSIKAVIGNTPVEIAPVSSSLSLQLENANDDNFTSQSVTDSEYTIGSDFNLENIEWTRDTQVVSPWLSDNKIIKSSKSSNGMINQIKQLAGNNLVKIFRKRAQLTVHFTFNGDASSFEAAGAYCNNIENSYMDGSNLIVPQVKYGRTTGSLLNFITNADATWFNSTALLSSEFKGATTENRIITIHMPDIKDKIMFTGWYGNSVVSNQEIIQQHQTLKTTYNLVGINNNGLSNIAVTENGGLLTWDGSGRKTFTRHRQLHYIHWERNGDEWGHIYEDKFLKEDKVIVDDTTAPDTYDTDGAIGFIPVIDDRKRYTYASENSTPRTFYATAHYNNIPAAVSVTAPNNSAAANSNQVVLFEGAYYVADPDMKSRVESLVSGVTVNVQKVITRYTNWSTTRYQTYYEVTKDMPNLSTQTSHQDTTGAISVGTETSYTYTPKTAAINIYGLGSQVTSIASTDPNITAQLSSQYLDSGTNRLVVNITYNVSAGFSFTSLSPSDHSGSGTEIILPDTWNQVLTYRFFN